MKSQNFILRPWKADDLKSLVKHANNMAIAKNMTNKFPHPYTEEAGRNFINFANADYPVHIFAIDISGEAIGGIGIHPQEDVHCKNAELGYWLAEPFWGKGIMSQAIPQMIEFAFKTYDVNRIFARPFGSNTASQHILEKCGFKLEARLSKTFFKNGEYLDEWIYAFRNQEVS